MQDLNKNSVLLLVRLSKPGNRRKVPSGQVQVDADKDSILVSKELLECEELEAVTSLDGRIRQYVYIRCVPSGVLKEGVYRLPVNLVDEVDAGLNELKAEREALVQKFMDVYPVKVEEARSRLRSLYDPSDYPSPERVRGAFGMEWRYLSLDIPQAIGQVLVAQEREKAARDVAAEMDEIRLALRTSFAELVEHAAEVLKVGTDGKPKVFRDTLVTNMEQFFNYFNARNLTDDTELATLVQRAKDILKGVSPEDLRNNMNLRKVVQKTMTEVNNTIAANVMLKPARRFTLTAPVAKTEPVTV